MKIFKSEFNLLVFPVLFCLLASTHLTYGASIKGLVISRVSKDVLAGAVVKLSGVGVERTISSNLEGKFLFKNLEQGSYNITCTHAGFTEFEQQVHLSADNDEKLINIELTVFTASLKEVIVGGKKTKETDGAARLTEKNSNQIVNVLSAQTIRLLPDITTASVMQRISGVVIDRSSSGEGRYPVIRGMDKRYNTTLINGIKIPSPDNNNRFVPLDLFPAELLQSLEVSKSLTPSMEGDAIGGTINLVMKDAPEKLSIQANIAGGYSTVFATQPFEAFNHNVVNRKSPSEANGSGYIAKSTDFPRANLSFTESDQPVNSTYGLTVGNRFGSRKQLGIVMAGSYQDIFRGTNSSFFFPNPQPGIGNVPAFSDIFLRKYSFEDRRLGLYTKLDYRFKSGSRLSLFVTYLNTNQFQSRSSIDSVLAIQRTGPGNGNVLFQKRSTWTMQKIFNVTLQGKQAFGDRWKIDWSAVYSIANQYIPDQAVFSTLQAVTTDSSGKASKTPIVLDGQMTREWFHNTDQDGALYLNVGYKSKLGSRPFLLKTGGLLRYKQRDNYYNPYALASLQTANNTPQTFTNIYDAQYDFTGSYTGGSGEINANTYRTNEFVGAAFIEGKLAATSKLDIIGGVRIEHTNDKYETVQPETSDGRMGRIYYNDLLPSVQLRYAVNDKQTFRLAYYKAISRPGYFEIVPTNTTTDYFVLKGNNNLDRSASDNIDLRYEFFPGGADQVLLGLFYKNITRPIELTTQQQSLTSNSTLVLNPVNFGSASNIGFEATVTKYKGDFGISANYNYTKSRITTTKSFLQRDSAGQIVTRNINETRPLQGQADHIANLSLLYKSASHGLDMQLSFVYTGSRIILISPYYGLDYYQTPYGQLDFSIEKRLLKKCSVFGKLNNLTNSPLKVELRQSNSFLEGRYQLPLQDNKNAITVQKDYYRLSFLFGFRYKM